MADPPTFSDVQRWISESETYWSGKDARCKKMRDMYNNEHPVQPPELKNDAGLLVTPYELRQGIGGTTTDSAVSVFGVDPVHSIDAPGLGSRTKARVERVEKFANSVMSQAQFESGEDTNDLTTFDAALIGISAKLVLPYPQAWRGYQKQGVGEDEEGHPFHA